MAKKICIFHQKGRCRNGDKCPYSHGLEDSPSEALPSAQAPHDRPCKHFLRGQCLKGDACLYIHNARPEPRKHAEDECIRVIKGALVRFKTGAAVASVTITSEHTSVRIDNLPLASTPASIAIFLKRHLEQHTEHDILVKHRLDTASAYVELGNPESAVKLCDGIQKATSGVLSMLSAVCVLNRDVAGLAARQANQNQVEVSWQNPSRVVRLWYTSSQPALRVNGKFRGAIYKIKVRVLDIVP